MKLTRINHKWVSLFFVLFYAVGLAGMLHWQQLFLKLVPFAILLSSVGIFYYHKFVRPGKEIALFIVIFSLGFGIEVLGVKTGLIFGHYEYKNALGFKLFETPLLIGINWLFLTYTALSITENLKIKDWQKIFLAPALMVVYDLVLEQVAPKMDMWIWQNSNVPVKNYIAWYIIALCFTLLLKVSQTETKNPLSFIIFMCQFVFFFILMFLL